MTTTIQSDIIAEKLQLAASYIARGWAAGNEARDIKGYDIDPLSPDARFWSLEGAIYAASEGDSDLENALLEVVKDQITYDSPDGAEGSARAFAAEFNYDSTHSDQVIGMLMRAAANARFR